MGQSTDAILAFGWNLGNVEELPWRDEEPQPWYAQLIRDIDELDDTDDFYHRGIELPPNPWDEIRNRENSWFYEDLRPGEFHRRETPEYVTWKAENQEKIDARFRAERAAKDAAKWVLESHCSGEYPMWIFAHKESVHRAYRGHPEILDLLSLRTRVDQWIMDLDEALTSLGLDPGEATQPSFILASDWG